MHTLFKTNVRKIVYGMMLLGIILAAFGSARLPAVHAQEGGTGTATPAKPPSEPPSGDVPGSRPSDPAGVDGAVQDSNGLWYVPAGDGVAAQANEIEPLAAAKSDEFGYTWKGAAYSWIDASGGSDTGINSSNDSAGPLDIGFPFKYYENVYSQIYISLYGFLAFGGGYLDNDQSEIPGAEPPNNVIAPYWSPVQDVYGYVRYLSGGAAPNRWFAVEWNKLESNCCNHNNEYTFEAILYENGDIAFQYGNMQTGNGWWCQASGIEDSTGLVGLSITRFCVRVNSNHAVHIYRPPLSARVGMNPRYFGGFTPPGGTVDLQIPVRNTGELGTDTFNLIPSSAWAVSLFASDGTSPLSDTNGDGKIDTGPIAQGDTATFVAKVHAPPGAALGAANTGTILVRSSLNTTKSKIATLQTAIPAPFAQVYKDGYYGAMSMYLVKPGAQQDITAADTGWWDYDPAVAEASNGNLTFAWDRGYCVGSGCPLSVYDIDYTLLDDHGGVVHPVSKLSDNSGATMRTNDLYPAVAVAPNGSTGVLWYRYLWDSSTSDYNYNIFFAILDASGNVAYGPTNLTNNTTWGSGNDQNVPWFSNPQISATGDNRFILAWQMSSYGPPNYGNCYSSYCPVNDIYFAVRDSSGAEILAITKFTNDTPGYNEGFYYPTLTALAGNRALLAWERRSDYDIYYAVLSSSGSVVKDKTNLSKDKGKSYDWRPDAVQLSDGNIAIAWSGGSYPSYNIRFAVLDASYKRIAGPKTLSNPAAVTGNDYVSVTADAAGHAVLTWMDYNYNYRRNLYYTLVDSHGGIVTQPMIFRSSQTGVIQTSFTGYGNTSFLPHPPSVPVLLAPAKGALVTDFTPALDWNDSTVPEGAPAFDHYQVQVDNNADFSSPEIDQNVPGPATNSEFTPSSDLQANTTDYWRVRSVNEKDQASDWSAVWNFRTALPAPSNLTADGTQNLRPKFTWDMPAYPGTAATGFTLQIAKDAGFTQIVLTVQTKVRSYVPTTNLSRNLDLFWRVQAKGKNGPSASSTGTYKTGNPPATPALVAPANKVLVTSTPTLKWTQPNLMGGTFSSYQVQIAQDAAFTNPILKTLTTLEDPEWVVDPPLASAPRYYWHVQACNTGGSGDECSLWSTVRTFRVK
jgi:hypothetical protein